MKIPIIIALLTIHSVSFAWDFVQLNGITGLFKAKMAFLVIYQPEQPNPINLTLSEGETQLGIKLVGVDVEHQRVEIDNDGLKQFLRLSSGIGDSAAVTPIPTEDTPRPITDQDKQAVANYLASQSALAKMKNGASLFTAAVGSGGNGFGGSNPKSGSGSNPANPPSDSGSDSNGTKPQTDYTKERWYRESLVVEQKRLDTANDVLAGEMTPLPRTPLTPSGTPEVLLGRGAFYSNHIPNYVVPGFVNPLVSL